MSRQPPPSLPGCARPVFAAPTITPPWPIASPPDSSCSGYRPGSIRAPFGAFLIVLGGAGSDGLVIGGAAFHGGPDPDGIVEIGYGVVASHQNRGYATRALALLIEQARALGARTLTAEVDAANTASRKVLEHCGFTGAAADFERFELALIA